VSRLTHNVIVTPGERHLLAVVDSQTTSRAGSQRCHGVVAASDCVKPLLLRRLHMPLAAAGVGMERQVLVGGLVDTDFGVIDVQCTVQCAPR